MEFESKKIASTNVELESHEFKWRLDIDNLRRINDLFRREVVSSLHEGMRFEILVKPYGDPYYTYNYYTTTQISIGLKKSGGKISDITALLLFEIQNHSGQLYLKGSTEKIFSKINDECFCEPFKISYQCNGISGNCGPIYFDNKMIIIGKLFLQSGQEKKVPLPVPVTEVSRIFRNYRFINATNENVARLQRDMKDLLQKEILADVEFHVEDSVLRAHKNLLSSRSTVFRKMFEQNMKEKETNSVKITDIGKPVFDIFLNFLYTGNIHDDKLDIVMPLYSVADKYEVDTLFKSCRCILVNNISVTTVTPILKLADMHNDASLKNIAVDFICKHFAIVSKIESWDTLLNSDPRLASNVLTEVSITAAKKC